MTSSVKRLRLANSLIRKMIYRGRSRARRTSFLSSRLLLETVNALLLLLNKWSLKKEICFRDFRLRPPRLMKSVRSLPKKFRMTLRSFLRLRRISSKMRTYRFKMPKEMSTLKLRVSLSKIMLRLVDRSV